MRPVSESNILAVGLIRNGEKLLYQSLKELESSFAAFNQIQWLIIESDSDDNTVNLLENLANSVDNFKYISAGKLREKIPQRTARIAYCRNIYLDEIIKNSLYENTDYIVVADLDGVNSALTESSISSCWLRDDWDVCTANQKIAYYDIWALRHSTWSPGDCWEQYKFMCKYINTDFSIISAVVSKMIEIPVSSEWIEVDSAFGGLAIYRRDAIINEKYVGLNDCGGEVCEHVAFHKELRSNGRRIFINPGLINGELNEHSKQYANLFKSMKIISAKNYEQ